MELQDRALVDDLVALLEHPRYHSIDGLEEALRLMQRDTRRYAKRQLTWFRKDQRIVWLEAKPGQLGQANRKHTALPGCIVDAQRTEIHITILIVGGD